MLQYDGTQKKESIVACVSTILSTVRGSMPYMRDMGISEGLLGRGTPQAADEYINEAGEQVEQWDERVMVGGIEVAQNKDGRLKSKVVLEDAE